MTALAMAATGNAPVGRSDLRVIHSHLLRGPDQRHDRHPPRRGWCALSVCSASLSTDPARARPSSPKPASTPHWKSIARNKSSSSTSCMRCVFPLAPSNVSTLSTTLR
eukprot:3336887-Rhodomonas_salina.1